jgi:hypothetical protein
MAACSAVVPAAPAAVAAPAERVAITSFMFSSDTFAFPNEIRAHHPDTDGLYANYCFVLARGLRQFFAFARFDASAPRLDHDGYVRRLRQVVARAPWEPALPPEQRVVVPGFANLRELSRAEEPAVKEALGPRFWTLVHWTNWRVTFPVGKSHQEHVAQAIMTEVRAGRLAQLLVTNWPKSELNHTVVAYAFTATPDVVEFTIWDPNEPDAPGALSFDRVARRFWASRLYDTKPGPIRVFRMYYSPVL